jgi:hypothetical protein
MVYKKIESSCKESFLGHKKNPQRTPNSFFAGFFMKSRRDSFQDLPKAGKKMGKEVWDPRSDIPTNFYYPRKGNIVCILKRSSYL